jgi:hypothetical protein
VKISLLCLKFLEKANCQPCSVSNFAFLFTQNFNNCFLFEILFYAFKVEITNNDEACNMDIFVHALFCALRENSKQNFNKLNYREDDAEKGIEGRERKERKEFHETNKKRNQGEEEVQRTTRNEHYQSSECRRSA